MNLAHLADEPHYVYRCYDDSGRLLYIGATSNLDRRAQGHRQKTKWFYEMATCKVTGPFVGVGARSRAFDFETRQIVALAPLYNRVLRLRAAS